jgi:hypothetical protein
MFKFLHKVLLTILLVASASQASAMWIQADWLDPTAPGVGTNRYSYAYNDPINGLDPGGNATRFTDEDGDGLNETATHFSPDDPMHDALTCGCSAGSDYVRSWDQSWGDLRGLHSALSGSQYASWTGHGFSGYAANGNSLEITRNSPIPINIGVGSANPGLPGGLLGYVNSVGFLTDYIVLSEVTINNHILPRHGAMATGTAGQFYTQFSSSTAMSNLLYELLEMTPSYIGYHLQRDLRLQVGWASPYDFGHYEAGNLATSTNTGRVVLSSPYSLSGGIARSIVTAFPVSISNLLNINN